jgi:Ca2+-transporting ATPase
MWQALPARDALTRLESSPRGLSPAEAEARLRRYGPNHFQRTPPVPAWRVLLDQFRSVLVLLLAAAAAAALLTGDRLDAIAIGAVLALNVAIGFVVELRARRAMEALVALEVTRAHVVRDGVLEEVDARLLVPGDIIELEAGQLVPADARLIESAELRTMEAALTGEPAPVDKDADAPVASDAVLAERATMVYKATAVVAGHGRAVVTDTGMATEVGRIGALAGSVTEGETPLERRLAQLGRRLAAVALVVAALVGVVSYAQGMPLGALLETALALAVAAVPEGLPVVGTIAMAVGVRRMARRRALIRRLPVVETLGSATVICTDKTGTLTSGHMTVTSIRLGSEEVEVSGVGFAPEGGFSAGGGPIDPARHAELLAILRVAALASRGDVTIEREPREGEPWVVHGDPTEAALVVAARKAGLDPERLRREWPEIGEVPFSSERRFMATFHRTPRGIVACLKGAPRRVLELSRITPDRRNALLDVNREMAGRGLRILAIATALVDRPDEAALGALDFLGFVGMSDPPAPGVPQTIRAFAGAGIRTVMLTGDQQRTAEAIAARLGLLSAGRRGLDGRAVDRMTDGELTGVVGDTVVFSRVSPEAKLRIVAAYQRRDDVVAMLGDGVNDAAALRQADIGVAMGLRGTDLAKEAADLVLADDRFPTIAAAVEEGRVIFDNLQKFVFYLFSCNLAEILVLLGAGLAGAPAVLLPLQILWLNLLTDTLPALALAAEPGEPGIMRQPPRDPRAGILSGRAIRATVGYAALIASVSLAAYVWGNRAGGPALGSTMTFMTLALAQIFHLGNARSVGPVLRPRAVVRNRFALGAVALAVGLQLLTVGSPTLTRVLRLEPLGGQAWAIVAALALAPALLGQAHKALRFRSQPAGGHRPDDVAGR